MTTNESEARMNVQITRISKNVNRQWRDRDKKTRVYVWPDGESVFENLLDRHDRPVQLFRQVTREALEALGYEGVRLSWSQRAGCSCPCSPGFIATHPLMRGFDIHIGISGYESGIPESEILRVRDQVMNLEVVTR